MGKKREAALQQEIDRMKDERTRREADRAAGQHAVMKRALKSMSEGNFAIVTKGGDVVMGQALVTTLHSKPIDVTPSGSAWAVNIPGPIEYSAQVVIKPLYEGE